MTIILLQMGKVASTAIADALRRAGEEVFQAHIGAPERLVEKYRMLMSAQVGDDVAARMYEDYLQELRVTFLLARRRVIDPPAEAPLKIVTLTRDPLDWYWSHFAQNYDHYSELLRKFHELHGAKNQSFDPRVTFVQVQQSMFSLLGVSELALDSVEALPELARAARVVDPSGVVFSQIYNFLLPLRWFDEDFLPATGIDVYAEHFDLGSGIGMVGDQRFSCLILKFEELKRLAGELASFVSLGEVVLENANVSLEKTLPFSVRAMRERGKALMPVGLLQRIYNTRYASHFGYKIRESRAERVGRVYPRSVDMALARAWSFVTRFRGRS